MDAILCMVAYGAYIAQKEYNGHNIIFRAFSPNVALSAEKIKISGYQSTLHRDICCETTKLDPYYKGLFSFCLYLPKTKSINDIFTKRYVDPLLKNLYYLNTIFPQWARRIYIAPSIYADKTIRTKLENTATQLCVMKEESEEHLGSIWRYFALNDPNVSVPVYFFDTDDYETIYNTSHNKGEWIKQFKQWLHSDKPFFIRRNGISNMMALPVLTGCDWGAKPNTLPNMIKVYKKYKAQPNQQYGVDEHMLRHIVWPYMINPFAVKRSPLNDMHIYFIVSLIIYLLLTYNINLFQ